MTSPLILGAMYFGTKTDRATSFALLDRFVEAGGTTIDTANCYAFWASGTGAGGQSETVIGEWLRANPGLRDSLTIATKVGVEPATPGDFDGPVEGLSAPVIRRECGRSLERLGVDRIDLYWAHGEDRTVELEETVTALGDLVRDGYAARLGVSNHPTWRVEQARAIASSLDLEPFTALQLTTSYLRPRPDASVPGKDHPFGFASSETLDYLTEHPDIELWAYSPLLQGSYDRDDRPFPEVYDHPGTTRRLDALTQVAADLKATRGQVVLAWLIASTPSIRPIVGVSSLEQLDEALVAGSLDLSEHLLGVLDSAS
ncbi:Oxidoreductase, aldo/keto reductase family protein [metagenome]|uniref:Oxidoreductase, aldo/keto reductase family protein n=1 Tax=metagenome TaxID=256318 RepID=A0A2P2CD89_9ZZZZ